MPTCRELSFSFDAARHSELIGFGKCHLQQHGRRCSLVLVGYSILPYLVALELYSLTDGLGLTIRLAQSLGLHRPCPPTTPSVDSVLGGEVW
jgi:hypothetical protein